MKPYCIQCKNPIKDDGEVICDACDAKNVAEQIADDARATPVPLADAELQVLVKQHAALIDFTGSPYDVRHIPTAVGEVWGIYVADTEYLLAGEMKRVEADAVCDQLNAQPGLLARLAAAEAPKWVSVKERLPEKWGSYLCHRDFIGEGGQRTNYTNMGLYDPNAGGFPHNSEVTHWQPLPAAPTVEGGQPDGSH